MQAMGVHLFRGESTDPRPGGPPRSTCPRIGGPGVHQSWGSTVPPTPGPPLAERGKVGRCHREYGIPGDLASPSKIR